MTLSISNRFKFFMSGSPMADIPYTNSSSSAEMVGMGNCSNCRVISCALCLHKRNDSRILANVIASSSERGSEHCSCAESGTAVIHTPLQTAA